MGHRARGCLPQRALSGRFTLHLVGAGMKITKAIAIVACIAGIQGAALPVVAQDGLRAPAEQPPRSFSGSQYVDSAGCVFIRAGVAGAVTWVPRVTRDRQQICGFEPTFAPVVTAAPVPAPEPVPQIEVIAAAPQPRVDPVVTPPAGVKPEPRAARTASVGTVVTLETAAAKGVSPQTRVLPKHLYETRKSRKTVVTPKGYRPAWTDGRLNVRRAEQTLAGQAQMRKIWTDTVPRRLID